MITNIFRYTDPTGYQTASAPGAVSWLGGGGGWGESGGWGNVGPHWSHYMPNVFIDPVYAYYDADGNYHTGTYFGKGEEVISPDEESSDGITYNGDKAQRMFALAQAYIASGFQVNIYKLFGKTYFVLSPGTPGMLMGDETTGYTFTNRYAAVFTGEGNVFGKRKAGGGGIDWSGVANATISMAGGAAEMAFAGGIEYFSIGLATPASGALMLDGSARVFANMQRFYFYLNGNPALGNAYPTSLGGIVGKGVDMAFGVPADKIGYGQAIGSWGNEIVSFSMVGGNGLAIFDFYESPSLETGIKYGLSFINYPYSLYFDKPTK